MIYDQTLPLEKLRSYFLINYAVAAAKVGQFYEDGKIIK